VSVGNDRNVVDVSTSTVTLVVAGMSCGHCEAAVRTEVGKVAGVRSVSVDLVSKEVVVTGSDLDVAGLVAAVDEAGYEATVR
jgi:copper chaperone CopZ